MSRRTSLISLGVGLGAAAVGAAVGTAAERLAVGRAVVRPFPGVDDEVPLGSLREVPVPVPVTDGIVLHAEIDEAVPAETPGGATSGEDDLTVVFCHGYALNLDSWHYQRLALQGRVRCVFWDQRGHGRSDRGDSSVATITQLGHDLKAVIDTCAPTGRLILVGHSMGGMTIMSFAASYPELARERVAGVALLATSSGGLAGLDLGLDHLGAVLHRLAPRAIALLAHRPGLVERTRRIGSDLEQVIVKRWSYGGGVDDELTDFTARMIAATRLEVVGDFMPQFATHDGAQGLAVLAGLPAVVITGDKDLMIPPEHSDVLAAALSGSEQSVVKGAGHLVMLEHPDVVTPHLVALVHRVRRARAEGPVGDVGARSVTPRRRAPRGPRVRRGSGGRT